MIPQYPSSIRWWNPPVILFFSWVEMHEIMRCKFSGARPESYKSTVEVALGHSWSVFSCALLCIFLRFGVDFCTTFWLLSRTKTVCHSGQNFHFFPKNYEAFLLSKSSKIWFKYIRDPFFPVYFCAFSFTSGWYFNIVCVGKPKEWNVFTRAFWVWQGQRRPPSKWGRFWG